jgi:hypothetical protein
MPIVATAMIIAWIAWADRPSDANMRQPQAVDCGENSEPSETALAEELMLDDCD